MSGRMRHRPVGQGLAVAMLGAMLGGATPALAGGTCRCAGRASRSEVGESDLDGALTIISANSEPTKPLPIWSSMLPLGLPAGRGQCRVIVRAGRKIVASLIDPIAIAERERVRWYRL
jgi:hypothetical protein